MASQRFHVLGGFTNRDDLEGAINSLRRNKFTNDQISVLMANDTRTDEKAADEGHNADTAAARGAATGAGTGAVVGGALGWLAGLGALAIPGVGPLLAAGPLAAAIVGATAGGTLGGLSGALLGLGLTEEEARGYESRFRAGEAIISISCNDSSQRDRAMSIIKKNGAKNVSAVERNVMEEIAAHTHPEAASQSRIQRTTLEPETIGSEEAHTVEAEEAERRAPSLAASIDIERSQIERRAFEIWQSEGCPEGKELEHWAQAEKELQRRATRM